jgi:hypothetical protein
LACSAYPRDDTFFVESDEPSQRMTMRDAAKMLARNKQEMIANELSRLACDEYLEDIMQHMRHMEVRTRTVTTRVRQAKGAPDC